MRRSILRIVPTLILTVAIFSVAVAWQAPKPAPLPPGLPPEPLTPLALTNSKDGPRYYKGNSHTHTLWSDGDDYPEMIADWYKRHGYDFLSLSDHNIIADGEKWIDSDTTAKRKLATERYATRFGENWLERRTVGKKKQVRLKPLREFRSTLEEAGKFLLVPGEEVSHRFKSKPVHMTAFNLRETLKPIDGPSVEEVIRVNMKLVNEQREKYGWDGLTLVNHPNFRWGLTAEQMLPIEELRYFEVFNGHPGVYNYGDATHASCERIWDILNAVRLGKFGLPMVLGVASDDAHGYLDFGVGRANPGRGWVMVKAPHLTAEAIVRAMRAGDFYFSSGVTLKDVSKSDKVLSLQIATEPGVTYKTEFIATLKGTPLDSTPTTDADGKALDVTRQYHQDIGKVVATSADANPSYTFTGKELYVRAKVTSSKEHPNPFAKGDKEVAWTQPVQP